jgi:hypothetical protein
MLKKTGIKETLDEIDDYDSFYNSGPSKKSVMSDQDEEDEEVQRLFDTRAEMQFYNYGEDIDFLRHHKRTGRNIQDTLQELLES